MRIMARRMKAATVVAYRSKSRAKRRLRLIQANVVSTIHRLAFESGSMGSLHDFQLPWPRCAAQRTRSLSPLSAMGENALDEREQSARPAQKMECSITVLNVGRMNNDAQQETQHIDQDVPLATFDLLARVVA
jgi:hypothetical protein